MLRHDRVMRILFALALVACGGSTPPARPAATVYDAGTRPPADASIAVIEDAGDVAAIESISTATTSQTPGRHPRVPGAPTQRTDDHQQIREAMRQHMQGFIACYEKLSPNAFPEVQLEFTIRSDGTVAKASATGAQGELDACVVEVLEGAQFPRPAGGGSIAVSYPLHFDPVAGP
jgi:hypothetical protein